MQKPCPFCGEQIQSVAAKCRYCGEWLDPSRRPDGDPGPAAAPREPSLAAPVPSSEPPPVATWAPPPALATTPAGHDTMSGTMKGLPVRQFYDGHDSGPMPTGPAPGPDMASGTGASGHGLPGLSQTTASSGVRPVPPAAPGSRLDDFERAFLGGGGDDLPADDPGDDDPFMSHAAAAPAPPPWGLIGAVVGCVAIVGLLLFKDTLFPPEAPPEPEPIADVKPPEPEPAPPPEAKAPPPETKAVIPPQVPVDAAFTDELAKARAAYTAGKIKAASDALTVLAKQAPDHPEVLLLTAQVQLEQEQLVEAQKTADRCVLVDPKLADCWLTLGVLRQNNKDNPGAVQAYEEYLKLAPTGRYARDATSQLARLKPK